MPTYKAAALARHQYLLDQFQAFPRPASQKMELRFVGNLPRAATLQDSINLAMTAAGIPIPEGAVEISPQLALQIKYLLGIFVKAAPETVLVGDDSGYVEIVYSFGCTRNFHTAKGASVEQLLELVHCRYEAPNAIAGVRAGRDEVYHIMHVALRKLADSKVTSAAWNAMQIIDSDARNWMSNIVVTALNMQEFQTSEAVILAVKDAFKSDDEWNASYHRALMHALFEIFTDSDWYGMMGFCIIWPSDVKVEVAVPEPLFMIS